MFDGVKKVQIAGTLKKFNGTFDVISKNLRKPTDGERLWLLRKVGGLAQDANARRLGFGEKVYAAFEAGAEPVPRRLLPRRLAPPSLKEKLVLARRRAGDGLAAVARTTGVSRVTLLAMERRGDPGLVAFWEKRGFRF